MGLYNNVPTFTYISASGITVSYNNKVYTVQSFYTNKKYIYWDSDNGTVLQASNIMPTRSAKTHLVLINDNGIATTVPSAYEGFEISYDGDSDETIKSRVYALYEKNKELGDKFVAIEQDFEGIKQIVGSGGNIDGAIVDRVSKIEQTAEDIKLSVNNIEKIYSDDKELTQLREDLNSSIINLNADLGTLSSEISDYYKDNKISSEEKVAIETMLSEIALSKSEVLKFVNKVILIADENGNTNNLNALNSAVSALENSHTNLVQNITVAISDYNITPSEKTVIVDAFAKYNLRINELKNLCDDIIFLGVGGIVSEQLAQINMKSNEIKLSINSVETNLSNTLSLQKTELESQIGDVVTSLGSFKDTIETTFKDGIIDEAEKKVLSEKLSQLEKEKLDIDAQFEDAYSNEFLIAPYNEDLKVTHDEYESKHTDLKNKILEVISFENIIDADNLAIQKLFNEYSVVLSQLQVALNNAFDIIATNRANKEILKAKSELLKELEDTNNKIDEVVENIDDYIGDGVVDSVEKNNIELSLKSLEKEKLDIDAQYNHWYKNSYLVNPLKTEYKSAYDNYISKYNSLVAIITNIINKDDLVSDTDRTNMMNAHNLLADSLKSFVQKTNQVIEFVSLKQSETVKNEMQNEIDDVNERLDGLDFVIDGTFEDNIIDQAERKVLSQNLSDLELQKTDVTKQYEQLYKSSYLDGTLKAGFKSSYDNFISKYNSLVSNIQYILSKSDLINDTDRTNITNAQSNLNTAFGSFVTKSNEVIEYITKKQSDENANKFNSELNELSDRVDGIVTDIGGVISDDILDQAERRILEDGLNDLEIQKNDVTIQYEGVYNNENLTDVTVKTNLKNSYDTFIAKYNNLVNNIQSLLDKTSNIDDTDRVNYQNAYDEFKESVTLFTEKFYAANDSITNKTMNDLKNSFNAEISDLNNAINDLDETMNGIFKDGILSEAEKISIREQLTILEREKVDVDNNYNSVYSNSNLSSSVKTNLKSSYDSYVESYNSLVSIINTILNKSGIISSTEQTSYKNALVTYRGSLGTYSSKLKEAIDNVTNNSIDSAKSELQNEINDVINSIGDLETNMNEVFKDGVLSEAEKTTIRQQLQTLYKEKGDVDNQYQTIYSNSFLEDSSSAKPKSELKTAYDNFVSKYNSLITVIDTILKKTTIVDSSDRTKLETALSNYRTASSNYITKSTNAIDAIASKKATEESEKINEKYAEILLSEDGIINRVGSVESTVTTHTTQLNTVDTRINNAKNSAISTAATDATTKANNALADAKTYTNGQITTVNKTLTEKVAEIKTTTDSITQRVSSTETTTSTLTEKVDITVKEVQVYYAINTSSTTAPTSGWSTTPPTWSDGKYIWSKTKTILTNGTSTSTDPVCITGAKGATGQTGSTGKGVSTITNYYLATNSSSGVTTSTSGWTTTIQSVSSSKKYLWNYEKVTYTDNTSTSTTPCIIGAYGDTGSQGAKGDKGDTGATGATGKGIKSIVEYYAVSSSNTTAPTSWSTTVQNTTTTNKYLWNYEVITYTDSSTTSTPKKVIGAHGATGATGATGTGIESMTTEYYLSTSKTTQTGGSWTTTQPTWSKGKYLWTRSKVVYKNPTSTAYTTPVCDSSWEAVNEVQPQIDANTSEITTTKNQVAELITTADSITQRVASTETTTKTLTTQVNTAQKLAETKAKVFTSTPTTPYTVGDLWSQGSGGDLMRCKTTRTSGSYTASDWEKANKYTDDTTANTALSTANTANNTANANKNNINTLTTTIKTTNDKVATIETNLSSITQRVSNTETTTTTLNNKVNTAQSTADSATTKANNAQTTANTANSTANTNKNNISSLTTRVSTAESKLTKDSLTTTIGSHYTTSSDVNGIVTSKGYATTSEVKQTTDTLTAKFSSSGGYNLLRNTGFLNGISQWNTNATITVDTSKKYSTNNSLKLVSTGATGNVWRGFNQRFAQNIPSGKSYTATLYYRVEDKSTFNSSFTLELKGLKTGATSETGLKSVGVTSANMSNGHWKKLTLTATTSEQWDYLYIYPWVQQNGTVWISDIIVTEGELETPWSPHPSEIYDGITKIDKNGITVTQSNAKSKTTMSADGFAITRTDNNKDIFKVDSNGLLTLNGVFKCYKNDANMTGARLESSGAVMFGYNDTGGSNPVFASGLWTDENMGYFSVGYTRADISDANGCLWMSPQQGNTGCRLTYSKLVGSNVVNTNLYFQKDGAIDFTTTMRGANDTDDVYTYRFDSGVSTKSLRCDNLRTYRITPRSSGTYDIGRPTMRYKDIYADSLSTTNNQLRLGTVNTDGSWQTYGALDINSSTGYIFPHKGNGQLSLGTSSARFYAIYLVNSPSVSSDERLKTDIHYLDEPMPEEPTILDGRVERNMKITTKDMYDFVKDDLKLASYRYNLNLERGNTSTDYGFIAQDILYTKVGSEIVQLEDKSDLNSNLSYNQGNYIATLAGALQEAIKKIEQLEDRIKELES